MKKIFFIAGGAIALWALKAILTYGCGSGRCSYGSGDCSSCSRGHSSGSSGYSPRRTHNSHGWWEGELCDDTCPLAPEDFG